jgi:hypothetical protein
MKNRIFVAAFAVMLAGWGFGVTVNLDVEQIKDDPKLVAWAQQAKELIEQWHPRMLNMVPSKGYEPTTEINLVFIKGNKGIAWTSGNRITVVADWVEKHPDDIGLVFHELVHVVQKYKTRVPGWVVEGVADYLRWAIYEGKPQTWFPYNQKEKGYLDSYQVTGGFFLWLETNRCPGIVSRINAAGNYGEYNESIITEQAGASLESLWADYLAERKNGTKVASSGS